MPLPSIEDFDDALIGATDEALGDTIAYKPAGGAFANVKAFVDYGETFRDSGSGQFIDIEISVSMSKRQVSSKPGDSSRLKLPKVGDQAFKPISVRDMGDDWVFGVKSA